MKALFPSGNFWNQENIQQLRCVPYQVNLETFLLHETHKETLKEFPYIYKLYRSKITKTEILNENYEDPEDVNLEYFFTYLQKLCNDNDTGDIHEQFTNDMYGALLRMFEIGRRNSPYKTEPEYLLKFKIGSNNEIATKPDRVIYERDNKILVIIEESKRRYTKTQEEIYPQLISELIGMAFHNNTIENPNEIKDKNVFGILIRARFFSFWRAKITKRTLLEIFRGQIPPSEETKFLYMTTGEKEWGFDIADIKHRKTILLIINEFLHQNT